MGWAQKTRPREHSGDGSDADRGPLGFLPHRLLIATCWDFLASLQYLSLSPEFSKITFLLLLALEKLSSFPPSVSLKHHLLCVYILSSYYLVLYFWRDYSFIFNFFSFGFLSSDISFLSFPNSDSYCHRLPPIFYAILLSDFSSFGWHVTVLSGFKATSLWHTSFRSAILLTFFYLIKTLCGIWPHYFSVACFHVKLVFLNF